MIFVLNLAIELLHGSHYAGFAVDGEQWRPVALDFVAEAQLIAEPCVVSEIGISRVHLLAVKQRQTQILDCFFFIRECCACAKRNKLQRCLRSTNGSVVVSCSGEQL